MDRPLWQILLSIFALGFVLQRVAMIYLFAGFEGGAGEGVLGPYALQVAAGAAFALGLWTGARWMLGALVALGVVVAGTGLYQAFFLGITPPVFAVGQVFVAALATGALFLILRHEFSGDGPGPEA